MLELFRSSAFRVVLAFAITTTAAIVALFGFVYLQITSADEARVRILLVDEAQKGLSYSDAELRGALELRLTRDLRRLDYVALLDPAGRIVLGNIAAMPAIAVDGKSHFVASATPPGAPDRVEPAIFVASRRADGSVLLLGRSLLEVFALRETVLAALATALAPALLAALGIGALFARRTSRRLARIHNTIARIMRGELNVRLPERRHPDEIDRVSRDVNLMLDEIVRLLVQLKGVGENIAHDLRAPLAVMRARLERGVESSDDRELRLAARQAVGELDKAMVTVAALLRIAQVENGPSSTGFEAIDLAAICADLFEFYEPLARAKSIAITLEVQSPVETMGDGDLMREALSNLIDNAIKFTPEGGAVRISATMEGGRATIRVSDSGFGVAPGERDKIFERFYRTAGEARIPGSGIGLSLVAAIANLHSFDLRASDNSPGAMFEISARAAPTAASTSAAPRAASNIPRRDEAPSDI